MTYFKCLDLNSDCLVELEEALGEKAVLEVLKVMNVAYRQDVEEISGILIARWGCVKKDRAARLLPYVSKIFPEFKKMWRKSTKNVTTNYSKSTENLPDFTTSNPHGSIRACAEETYTDTKQKQIPPTPQGAGERFLIFWEAYPRKDAQMEAERVWQSKQLDPRLDEIMAGLKARKASDEWKRSNGQFVPHAAKFLRDERWLDAVDPPSKGGLIKRILAAREVEINSGGEVFWVPGKALQYLDGKNLFSLEGREYFVDQIAIKEEG